MLEFIQRNKTKFFLLGAIVATVWALLVTNYADAISAQPFWMQFLLTAVPAYFIPSFIVGIHFNGDYRKALGVFFISSASDLLAPSLAVTTNGVITQAALFSNGAVDVFLGTIYQMFGINGFLLFIFVYPLSFIALLGAGIYLLTEKEVYSYGSFT